LNDVVHANTRFAVITKNRSVCKPSKLCIGKLLEVFRGIPLSLQADTIIPVTCRSRFLAYPSQFLFFCNPFDAL